MNQPSVGVGIIGCGYVVDHYLSSWQRHPQLRIIGVADRDAERVDAVAKAYGLRRFGSTQELLDHPDVEIVVNLTSIGSHHEVTRAALEAGKHVYSEKPLAEGLDSAQELVELARDRELLIGTAPSNVLSPTIQTMWRAVRAGAVGTPRIVYAEFDDNPIYLMHPEQWRSRTGAPWPYIHEYEHGCTVEHAGYHLTWLCALFGPVESVTAFSKQVIPHKSDEPLDPVDAPDFSVACLNFRSGVVARLTFSIAAPIDHRMRIIGDKGMVAAETYQHYECPVYLETFNDLTLNARKARTVRSNRLLQRALGVGGRRLELVPAPYGEEPPPSHESGKPLRLRRAFQDLKRRETGTQDKCAGIAELAAAITAGRPPFPAPDLTLHVTELTYAIQAAGTSANTYQLTTTFETVAPPASTVRSAVNLKPPHRTTLLNKALGRQLRRMHQH